MEAIGRILTVQEDGYAKPFASFRKAARAMLPEAMHCDFRLLRVRNGVFTVACRTAGVAHALASNTDGLREAAGAERLRFLITAWS